MNSKRRIVGLLIVLLGFACEPVELETLKGVTVVAVQADPPLAQPGQTVQLTMTVFDRREFADANRAAADSADSGIESAHSGQAVQVVWFGGCHNPPGENPLHCVQQFPALAQAAEAALQGDVPADPEVFKDFGLGKQYSLQIPPEPVSSRARASNLLGFGTSYVFFAACRGRLEPRPAQTEGIPLACVDSRGRDVAEAEFVLGYTTIYVFDELTNVAPAVTQLELDGERIAERACEQDAECESVGKRLSYACDAGRCLPTVSACDSGCSEHTFAPVVPKAAIEPDPTRAVLGAEPRRESLWVRYYALGTLDRSESLLSDHSGQLRERFATRWTPPARAFTLPVPLWAVVQDNRGGTTVLRADVLVR